MIRHNWWIWQRRWRAIPDNSTPALLGGFVAAAMEENHVYCAQCPVPEGLGFVAVIPDFELKTADARRALPDSMIGQMASTTSPGAP